MRRPPTNGPPGNLFQAIAGTSMASPHAAGVSLLVKASHPSWTPEEIKSALMTSSVQDVVKEDGVTPASVFDDGAGSIRADRAVNPTLVFNETYADFVAAGTDPLHRVDLNVPSIDATTMPGLTVDGAHRDQRLRQEPESRRPGHAAGGRHDHRRQEEQEPSYREGQHRYLPDHDQRIGRSQRSVRRVDQARAGKRGQSRLHSRRLREATGNGDPLEQLCSRDDRGVQWKGHDGSFALHHERVEPRRDEYQRHPQRHAAGKGQRPEVPVRRGPPARSSATATECNGVASYRRPFRPR